jgi:hypothetical protein
MAAISTSIDDELKDAVYQEAARRGQSIAEFTRQALSQHLIKGEEGMSRTYDRYLDILVAEDTGVEDQDEWNVDSPSDALKDAELAFYDAYTNGSHAAWVHESERLAQAIERRYNLAKVRCPYSAVYGTTARHTVSCDECGWCVEFDGRVRPVY